MALTKAKLLELIENGDLDSAIFLRQHPVGRLVFTTDSTNPGTIYGGMWEAWGSGRVPVGVDAAQTEFDTVEKTGGEKTHTLSIAEAAVHYHLLYNSAGGASEFPAYSGKDNGTVGGSPTTGYGSQTTPTGGGEAHNNLQPYVTCYIWKRTA